MTALWILLGLLAILTLLLLLPLSLRLTYMGTGSPRITVRLWRIPIADTAHSRTPQKKKKVDPSVPSGSTSSKKSNPILRRLGLNGPWNAKTIGASAKNIRTILEALVHHLGSFSRRIKVSRFRLRITIAEDAPDKAALTYGAVCSAIYPAAALVDAAFPIQQRDVSVTCDFLSDHSRAELDAIASVRVLPALRFLLSTLWELRGFLKK